MRSSSRLGMVYFPNMAVVSTHTNRLLRPWRFLLFLSSIVFVAVLPVVAVSAQVHRYLDGLSTSAGRELMTDRSVSRTHTSAEDIQLAPSFPGIGDAVKDLRSIGTNIVSERLILVDGSVHDDDMVKVYNALLGVSNLAYLEYFNTRTGLWKDLFKDSYRVDNEHDLNRLPDIRVETIPEYVTIPVLQGLPPFGDVLQTYRYESISLGEIDGFRFSSENDWDIRYRGIRVVKAGEMATYAWAIRGEDYLLVYGIGAAKVFTGFGLFRDRIESSFTSRTDGLFDWLSENYLDHL